MIRFKIKRASVVTTRERNAKSYSDCTILAKAAIIPDDKGNLILSTDSTIWNHNIYIVIENTKWK